MSLESSTKSRCSVNPDGRVSEQAQVPWLLDGSHSCEGLERSEAPEMQLVERIYRTTGANVHREGWVVKFCKVQSASTTLAGYKYANKCNLNKWTQILGVPSRAFTAQLTDDLCQQR